MHFAVHEKNKNLLWISSSGWFFLSRLHHFNVYFNEFCMFPARIHCQMTILNAMLLNWTMLPRAGPSWVTTKWPNHFESSHRLNLTIEKFQSDNCACIYIYLTYRHIKKHDNQNSYLIRKKNDFIWSNYLFLCRFFFSLSVNLFMVSIINHTRSILEISPFFSLMTSLHDGFGQSRRCHTYWKIK